MAEMDIWIRQFQANVYHAAQQQGSVLFPYVTQKRDVQGSRIYFDTFGSITAQNKTTVTGIVTPLNQSKTRRAATMQDFEVPLEIARFDIQRELCDPKSAATISAGWAAGRWWDSLITTAFTAAVTTVASADGGAITESTSALPSAQIITDLTNDITVDKVNHAHQILDSGYVPKDGRVLLIGASQRRVLFGTSTLAYLASSDYVANAPLANASRPNAFGWNGCTVVQYEGLTLSSTTRKCIMFHPMYMGLGVGQMTNTRVTQEALLRHNYFSYTDGSGGAARIVDAGVVEIDCVEA